MGSYSPPRGPARRHSSPKLISVPRPPPPRSFIIHGPGQDSHTHGAVMRPEWPFCCCEVRDAVAAHEVEVATVAGQDESVGALAVAAHSTRGPTRLCGRRHPLTCLHSKAGPASGLVAYIPYTRLLFQQAGSHWAALRAPAVGGWAANGAAAPCKIGKGSSWVRG